MTERTVTFDDEEWQLVPRRPTPAMLGKAISSTATWQEFSGSGMTVNYKKMSLRYRAMLSVAPCPYKQEQTWDQQFECALAERSAVYRDQHMIGEYGADYSMPTQAELQAPDPEVNNLLKNSRSIGQATEQK